TLWHFSRQSRRRAAMWCWSFFGRSFPKNGGATSCSSPRISVAGRPGRARKGSKKGRNKKGGTGREKKNESANHQDEAHPVHETPRTHHTADRREAGNRPTERPQATPVASTDCRRAAAVYNGRSMRRVEGLPGR